MNNILVINSGSSSLKFKVFSIADQKINLLLASGRAEEIGDESSRISIKFSADNKTFTAEETLKDHEAALALVLAQLQNNSIEAPAAIGHRVVHGGGKLLKECILDDEILQIIEQCSSLAPLHNPANLTGIYAAKKMFKGTVQVGVFDTAFHSTMPALASTYALPHELTEEGYRAYGFHGISHEFIMRQLAALTGKDTSETSLISCHLGNGASLCAIKNGISIDTSMGYTPLEGVVMGTRSGDIDAGLVLALLKDKGYSTDELDQLLNKKSGLLGISGLDNDMRTLLEKRTTVPRAELAIEIYCYRLARYIGSYLAILSSYVPVVFTAGVGENSAYVRENTMRYLGHLGYLIDPSLNLETRNGLVSAESSHPIYVISTDEEKAIAEKTLALLNS